MSRKERNTCTLCFRIFESRNMDLIGFANACMAEVYIPLVGMEKGFDPTNNIHANTKPL